MTVNEFKELALSFADTEANPHFDRTAFKVIKKRVFATIHEASGSANIKFSAIDQTVFCTFNKEAVFAVPNKWGLQGWTTFTLDTLPKEFVKDALETAYREVFSGKK